MFLCNLVDFVNEHDSLLGLDYVPVGGVQKAGEDVLHIVAYITGFRQGSRISNRERHLHKLRQSLCNQRLAASGRTDQKDIGLVQIRHPKTLEVFMYAYCNDLLRTLLSDDMSVKIGLDVLRSRDFPVF